MLSLTYVMISVSIADMIMSNGVNGTGVLTKVPRPAGLLGDSSQHPVVILLLLLKRVVREREEGKGQSRRIGF